MNSEVWQRAREIFDLVLDEPTERQARRLDELCGGNTELETAVASLLEAHKRYEQSSHDPLVDGMAALIADDLEDGGGRWIGRSFGPYRIVERIGQGGMSDVFLAQRDDAEFEKRVAVKILRFGLAGDEHLRRFRLERQVLAKLEHPDIARLIDGGSTPEGVPYLVMELVEGQSLVEFCDDRRRSLEERIELFRRICAAVQSAHQNLVIHRDLKPSNILVTDEGAPKLLDFGIAKLLTPPEVAGETAAPSATVTMARMLTPDYASPEQFVGQTVTTASDVYSLGVVLYELLVGRRPFNHSARSTFDAPNDLEVPAPSTIWRTGEWETGDADSQDACELAASARRESPTSLRRALRGDLDNIVRRAMDPDPGRRYGTVRQFADDLDRYQNGLPVEARPAGLGYRIGKFLARHRAAVAAATLGLGLLVAALVFALLQRDVARLEKDRAEEVTRLLLEAFAEVDPDHARGDAVSAREILDVGARRLMRDLSGRPRLQATMMHTIGNVYSNLGLFDAARPLLEGALEIRTSGIGTTVGERAASLHAWGELLFLQGEIDAAEAPTQEAFELRSRAGRADAAESLHLLAQLERARDRRERGIELHRQALQWTEGKVGEDHRDYVEGLRALGVALRSRERYDEAEVTFERALAIQRRIVVGDHPHLAALLGELASLWEARRQPAVALPIARDALAMNRRLYGDAHPEIARNLNTLGNIEQHAGRPDEATELYLEGIELERKLLGESHPRLAYVHYNLATLLHRELDKPIEAEPLYAFAVDLARRTLGSEHTNLGFFSVGYGDVLTALGRPEEAVEVLTTALAIFESGTSERNRALAVNALGGARLAQGDLAVAERLLLESDPILRQHFDEDHRIVLRSQRRLEQLHKLAGRVDLVQEDQPE